MKPSIFVAMEMQTGTEKLAEALMLRGFPVKVEEDFITLHNGSEQDYQQLEYFLDQLNIPVFWNGDRFQLLVNRFPQAKMRQIIYHPGREHLVSMEGYHYKWRSFVNRRYGIRTNTLDLCPCTAILVKALNEAGIVALTGCHGHRRHNPNIQLSGVYFGVWFSIIQEKFLQDLPLHYQWKVEFTQGRSNATIIATKKEDEAWDKKSILSDCTQMASILRQHAADIRQWKKNTFKRNMKTSAETYRQQADIHQLHHWMKQTAQHGDGSAVAF